VITQKGRRLNLLAILEQLGITQEITMKPTHQWIFVAFHLTLVTTLGLLYAVQHWPASDYADAMAKGQYAQAPAFLNEQIEQGNPQAITALANLHYLGLGVERDLNKAASLYHQAASNGYAAAQLNLGHLYKQGMGVGKNAEKAFAWYVHADIAGSPWAEYYKSQLSVELTLTPLQMSVVRTRWRVLDDLAAEPL